MLAQGRIRPAHAGNACAWWLPCVRAQAAALRCSAVAARALRLLRARACTCVCAATLLCAVHACVLCCVQGRACWRGGWCVHVQAGHEQGARGPPRKWPCRRLHNSTAAARSVCAGFVKELRVRAATCARARCVHAAMHTRAHTSAATTLKRPGCHQARRVGVAFKAETHGVWDGHGGEGAGCVACLN